MAPKERANKELNRKLKNLRDKVGASFVAETILSNKSGTDFTYNEEAVYNNILRHIKPSSKWTHENDSVSYSELSDKY